MKIALVFCSIDNIFNKCQAGVFSLFESNPPLGLGAIGTIAKEEGHEVRIFDQFLHHYDNERLIKEVLRFEPDIVGFSCTSLNIENSKKCAIELKKNERMVFAGGIHISLCLEKVRKAHVFDFLISGEGEEVFRDFLNQYCNGTKLADIKIKGYSFADDSEVVDNAILCNINQPIIDRSLFELNLYSNKGALLTEQPCYSIFSSRGCPYHCKFCSKPDYFKLYRKLDIDRVIQEIKELISVYGAKSISFREDNFTIDINRLKLFCGRMIDEFSGNFFWECESRADLPKDVLQLMFDAGCRGIWCGVETVVPKWSEWINKELTKEKVVKFYDDCEDIGIKTGALFMFGFPYQTDEEIDADVEFATSLPTVFSAFQCLAIFPGSPLFDFYNENPSLKYDITEGVSLGLIQGHTFQEMISMEREINRRIKSSRYLEKD